MQSQDVMLMRRSAAPSAVPSRSELSREELWARLVHNERLAQAGLIASGLIHDTRNMLAVVQGYVALAAAEVPAGTAHELLGEAQQGAIRACETLKSLLTFSKNTQMEAGRCDVSHVVGTATRFLATPAAEQGVTLACTIPGRFLAQFNEQVLLQAVTNLVMNAIRACPRGSHVHLTLTKRGNSILLDVEDDGPGIPQAVRARLFEPFSTSRATTGGTGLGLFITKQLVEEAGGRVGCVTTGPEGTSFQLVMPKYDEEGSGTDE